MTKRSPYLLAAMASAIAPKLSVVAVHDAANLPETGVRKSIETSVVLDAKGAEYDIAVAESPAAGRLLRKRALAAKLLGRTPATQGLGIRLEQAVATGDVEKLPVTITRHLEGTPVDFGELSLERCTELGTAIATIHLLDSDFLLDAGYPRFSAEGIRKDLDNWVAQLKASPEVPEAIAQRWGQLTTIDALWDFTPRVIHGDYSSNDVLFRDDSVHALRNWEQIQVSDPARDFAWAYNEWISDDQRDALLSAYGRMMGSHMDARIVPRARMWRQLDIVRDLLQALSAADREWIRAARERVERLANILSPVIPVTAKSAAESQRAAAASKAESSTITVGNLLAESQAEAAAAAKRREASEPPAPARVSAPAPAQAAAATASPEPKPHQPTEPASANDASSSTLLSQRSTPRDAAQAVQSAAQSQEARDSAAPAQAQAQASAPATPPEPQASQASAPETATPAESETPTATPLSQELRLKPGYVSLDTGEHTAAKASSENELGSRAAETIIIPKATNPREDSSEE